jgi:hypothetical protein
MLYPTLRPRHLLFAAALSIVPGACSSERTAESERYQGSSANLGNGTVNTYVELDAAGDLVALGVRLSESTFENLPLEPDGTAPCFDIDGNGVADPMTECFMMLRRNLQLSTTTSAATAPFGYVQFNYNPMGHPAPAPAAYAVPHFDFHFYLVGQDAVEALRTGTCGFLMDCELYERARVPVPDRYMPPTYIEVGAAAGGEGNHLLPSTAPELADPPADLTQTFIFGSYDGHITFYEPMIAASFFTPGVDACYDVAQPAAWEVAGPYPTEYCVRYLPDEEAYTVSLESFVHRDAT